MDAARSMQANYHAGSIETSRISCSSGNAKPCLSRKPAIRDPSAPYKQCATAGFCHCLRRRRGDRPTTRRRFFVASHAFAEGGEGRATSAISKSSWPLKTPDECRVLQSNLGYQSCECLNPRAATGITSCPNGPATALFLRGCDRAIGEWLATMRTRNGLVG